MIAGLIGFIIGLLTEKYIRRAELNWRMRRQLRKEMGSRADDTTTVTRIGKGIDD
jgi:hypothetical protein